MTFQLQIDKNSCDNNGYTQTMSRSEQHGADER
jgi:hypothetical protein